MARSPRPSRYSAKARRATAIESVEVQICGPRSGRLTLASRNHRVHRRRHRPGRRSRRVIARHEAGGARAGPGAAGAQLRRGHRVWWPSGWRRPRAGSPRSGCCRPPGRRAMRGRRATSGGWSRRGRRCGATSNHRGRRPAVWSPGEHLVIDWGVLGGLHVFCAVLAWSRVRFVRFADNERADTTLALLAECFEHSGRGPRGGAGRPDGLPEGRGGREQGRAHRRVRAVRRAPRVPARLLRGRATRSRRGSWRTWSATPRPT